VNRKADFLQNESIRLKWITESIRIANRNALVIGPVSEFVGLWLRLCVCLWVRYHDNSKLHTSIFTKLGLGKGSDHLQLIKFWPSCAPGKGICGGAKIFGSTLLEQTRSVCVSQSTFFILCFGLGFGLHGAGLHHWYFSVFQIPTSVSVSFFSISDIRCFRYTDPWLEWTSKVTTAGPWTMNRCGWGWQAGGDGAGMGLAEWNGGHGNGVGMETSAQHCTKIWCGDIR